PAGSWDLLVLNYDCLEGTGQEALERLVQDEGHRRRVLIYSRVNSREELARLLGSVGLTNILGRSPDVDAEELPVTIHKLLSDDIFGIEKYFPWGAMSKEATLMDSAERHKAIEDVRAFAEDLNVPRRLAEVFSTVADELITNAFYNAPVDAAGRALFAHMS